MTHPAWINRAAEEITRYVHRTPPTFECLNLQESGTKFKINSIISAHAPQPKALEWVRQKTVDPAAFHEQARTVFGEYDIMRSGMSEIYWMNGSHFSTIEAARAAAYAHFCAKLAACYEEAHK